MNTAEQSQTDAYYKKVFSGVNSVHILAMERSGLESLDVLHMFIEKAYIGETLNEWVASTFPLEIILPNCEVGIPYYETPSDITRIVAEVSPAEGLVPECDLHNLGRVATGSVA